MLYPYESQWHKSKIVLDIIGFFIDKSILIFLGGILGKFVRVILFIKFVELPYTMHTHPKQDKGIQLEYTVIYPGIVSIKISVETRYSVKDA